MKLTFFSFAFLLGVLLIHADNTPAKGGPVDGSTDKPLAPETSISNRKESKSTIPETPPSKSDAPNTEQELNPSNGKAENHENQSSGITSPLTSTTSTPLQTTTSKPSPHPAVPGFWNVTDSSNHPCIMIKGTISLNVTWENDEHKNETKKIDFEPETKTIGTCADKYIRWILDSHNSTFQFKFFVNESTKEVYVGRVDGQYNATVGNHKKIVGFNNVTIHAFETPLNKSYACGKSIELPLVEKKEKQVSVTLNDFQIQAFKNSKNHGFDESIDGCPTPSGGGSPDIIPIVVGCALAILVVVVLVAYLINRRRSQAHGYLSM